MEDSKLTFDPCEALTISQAAALLHVSRPTLTGFIRAGELPSARIGRCRRIRRVDLAGWLEARTGYGWRRHEPEPARPVDGSGEGFAAGEDLPF